MLYQQAIQDMLQANTLEEDVSDVVEVLVREKAGEHRQAIKNEMQRREDKKNEAARIKREAERAQARRRERRRCLREQVRITLIQDKILDTVFEGSEKIDYNSQVLIHDIRDYATEAESENPQALYVIGGFVGELIITFTALYDFLLANPANEGFRFTSESMEKFLNDVLPEDYPADIVSIKLVSDPLSKD